MKRQWMLSGGRRLVVSRDEGEQDFDFELKRWVDVRWMLVMWFPPTNARGSVESGQAIGGQSRREAFAKMRVMLATQPPPVVCFVPSPEQSGVFSVPREAP